MAVTIIVVRWMVLLNKIARLLLGEDHWASNQDPCQWPHLAKKAMAATIIVVGWMVLLNKIARLLPIIAG
jgi:hypothetical protein